MNRLETTNDEATPPQGMAGCWTYFIDESGNSGDLILPGADFSFDSQEIFALSAVGVADTAPLANLIDGLKEKHRVQAPELKFDSVRKKPRFVADLIDALIEMEAHLLSEVVDKRYFIAAHMVSALILPPIPGHTAGPGEHFVRNGLAEYLSRAPIGIFQKFVSACQAPSGETIAASFQVILDWLDDRHRGQVASALRQATQAGFAEFRDDGPDRPATHTRWLPAPDASLSGAPLWILPNLSSFTNLNARINRAHNRALKDVRLVHDEQRYYAHVLSYNKQAAEDLVNRGFDQSFKHADWTFTSSADLTFANSTQAPGVQIADVLAGFLMSYVRNKLHRTNPTDPESRELFHRLIELGDPDRGLGINFVAADTAFAKLGILPKLDPWILSTLKR